MQCQQDSQRVLFDTIDRESLIPDDHLLRRHCQTNWTGPVELTVEDSQAAS